MTDTTLPPEVANILHDMRAEYRSRHGSECDVEEIEAEFFRLAEENARLLAANRDCVDHFEQMRGELAALKARFAEAGKAECRDDGDLDGPALIAYMAEEDVGKVFALVKLEGGE